MKYASLLAIASALLTTHASAQWYVGANVGTSDVKRNDAIQTDQFLDLGFDSATITSDKRDVGFRLFGGYQLHKNFALEAAYVDLGKFSFRGDVTPAGTLNGATKISGAELSALGILPINERISVFARLGAFSAETKTAYSGNGSVEIINGAETQKKRSTNLSYGVGATVNINKRIALRSEWARYTKLGNTLTGGQADANLYSIGVVYRF
jgi:OmpA-OmpF porin, OOP family